MGRRCAQQRQVEGGQERQEVDSLHSLKVDVEVPKDYQGGSNITSTVAVFQTGVLYEQKKLKKASCKLLSLTVTT